MPDLFIICACIRARHLDVHTHTETHTQGEKYINCIFSCTYRPVIEQQPAQFLKVSARRSVMVSQHTHASSRYPKYINLFVCITLETFVISASEACLGISATCPSSILRLHMSECVFCVCMHSVLSAISSNTPVRTPTHKKTPRTPLNHETCPPHELSSVRTWK